MFCLMFGTLVDCEGVLNVEVFVDKGLAVVKTPRTNFILDRRKYE